jgi:hypothetical protein
LNGGALLFYNSTTTAFIGGIRYLSATYDSGTGNYVFTTTGYVSASIDPTVASVRVYRNILVGMFYNESSKTFEYAYLDKDLALGSNPTYTKRANISAQNITATGSVTVAGTINLGPASGEAVATIQSRTIPSGQGNSNERSELILFQGNDPGNGSGPDVITLRSPWIRMQTFNNAGVGDANNNSGSNTRLQVDYFGNVCIGTTDGTTGTALLDLANDFHIGANSSAWNNTATKGLYFRYSTNGTNNAAFI